MPAPIPARAFPNRQSCRYRTKVCQISTRFLDQPRRAMPAPDFTGTLPPDLLPLMPYGEIHQVIPDKGRAFYRRHSG